MSFNNLVVLTATHPDAVADILNSKMFEGAIDSISGVTRFVDLYFSMFITLVAFFIISAALLRNVIAGAYAAYPKFWDMVAETKETVDAKAGSGPSILYRVIAFFIPDLKSMSDFHDSTVEPKDYFMKAIPQMVLVVMIGIVIYNGYYRDAIGKVGNLATIVIDEVILSVDPREMYVKIFDTATRPDFSYASINTDQAKTIYKISEEIYSTVITAHTDVKSEAHKSELVRNIENRVAEFINNDIENRYDTNKYKLGFNATRVSSNPDLTGLSQTDSEFVKTFGLAIPTASLVPESKQHLEGDWHVRVIVQTTEIPQSKPLSTRALSNVTMTIGSAVKGKTFEGKTYTHAVKVNSKLAAVGGTISIGDSAAVIGPDGTLYFNAENGQTSFTVSGLRVNTTDADGQPGSHTIRTLEIKGKTGDVTYSVNGYQWKNDGYPSDQAKKAADDKAKEAAAK